ncbi:hypothetical protein DIS24_g3590 [Lasiodiplodia hormozganensis]|uniref:Heterokaryon incompatibility domain-containing protein n=1 Tax=Lasiodiplodia hormozganensis TaxID=869390 RepID=A0AA39YWK9_9PEZI|nr:hypothetical protein DIS24_g3590 [Lasiodiplodia hormozganensis]
MDNLASLARASDPINFPDNIADDEWRVTKALDDQLAKQMPSRRWRPMHDPYAYLAASSSSSPRHRHSDDDNNDDDDGGDDDDNNDDDASDASDADLVIFKRINTHKVGVQDAADAQIFVPAAPAAVRQPHEAPFGYERDDANMKLLIWLESDARRPPEKGGVADGDFFLRGSQHGFCWACLDALEYYIKHTRGDEGGQEEEDDEKVVGGGREEEKEEDAEGGGEEEEEDKKRKKGERVAKKKKRRLPRAVVHHWNLLSLVAANGTGCAICKRLHQRLERSRAVDMNQPHSLETHRLEMCWANGRMGLGEGDVLYFVHTDTTLPRSHSNYHTYYRMQLWDIDALDANMSMWFPDGRKWFEDHGVMQVATSRMDSDRSRLLAKGWLTRCEENVDGMHDECNAFVAKSRPTRVLDVEHARQTSRVRLVCVEDDAAGDRYITLSHCWGEWGAKELPMLTTANLEERQTEGMNMADLPQTFRDALEVASWYKVKWLWIDSLCIVQDSPSDWLREASLMARTYKHAVLNISADNFSDARGGLFAERDPWDIVPIQFHATRAAGIMPSSQDDLARSWWLWDYETDAFGWANTAPSFARAWIHRERQLARRVLHFTDKELVWECCASSRAPAQALACETFPGGYPFRRLLHGHAKWQARDVRNNGGVARGEVGLEEVAVHETWNELCEGFSQKWLTVSSDMPIILSSLAEEFGDMLPGDAYLAGHWESTLPLSLLWRVHRWPGRDVGEFSSLPHAIERKFVDRVVRETAEEITEEISEIARYEDKKGALAVEEETKDNNQAFPTSSRVTGLYARAKRLEKEMATKQAFPEEDSSEACPPAPTDDDTRTTHGEDAAQSDTTQPKAAHPVATQAEKVQAETTQSETTQSETTEQQEVPDQDDTESAAGPYFSYVAASWSWFSVNGAIEHHGRWPQVPLATFNVDDTRLRNAFGPFSPDASSLTLTGYMRRIEVIYTGADVVESLYTPDIVSLRSKYDMVAIDHDDLDDADLRRKGPDRMPKGVRKVGQAWRQKTGRDFEVKLDFSRGEDLRLQCFCLFLAFDGKKCSKYDLAVTGLLLEPVEGGKAFTRIGLVSLTALTALKMRYMIEEGEMEPDEQGWKTILGGIDIIDKSKDEEEFNESGPEALYRRDEERSGLNRLRKRDIKLV